MGWNVTIATLFPGPGDVVVYGTGEHVAVITENGIKMSADGLSATIVQVRSKWGSGAIYDHDPNECPYGTGWSIWRRKGKVANCLFEDCNSLLPVLKESHGVPPFVTQIPYVKDDAHNKIYFQLSPLPPGGHTENNFLKWPSVHLAEIPPNRYSFDCRGFVFAKKAGAIQSAFLFTNQTVEILQDGYDEVHGFDTGSPPHYH